MTDNISKIFDINPPTSNNSLVSLPQQSVNLQVSKIDNDNHLEDDLVSSIEDYTILMDQGKIALQEILTLATETQSARFFEAAALMIKNLADTNAGRMDVHHKLYQIKKMKQELGLGAPKTTNMTVFVGSTSNLLQQVKPRIIDVEDASVVEYEET